MIKIIQTTNEEVDRQFGGGIPTPSLILIEGDFGSGKSSITAQMLLGFLRSGMKILYFSESGIKEYIEQMKSISYNFSIPFLQNQLKIIPLHVYGLNWSEEQASLLLPVIYKYIGSTEEKYDCIVIDSMSLLTMYATPNSILNFITRCKHLTSNGISVIMTMQPDTIHESISPSVKASCDIYLKLESINSGGKSVKQVSIIKMLGSTSMVESSFAFEVDNSFGVKIVPVSTANT